MELHGKTGLSLLDYPGHLACTFFTGRCNLRCPFCQNAGLVIAPQKEPVISMDEALSYLKKRAGLFEGVCISGGEPTLQPDLADFLRSCRELGYLTKLDTNGTRPEVLASLLSAGLLDYIAMDIKNSPHNYVATCGTADVSLPDIERSIRLIRESGISYEFRTTIVTELHKEGDLIAIGEWLRGAKRYALQAFRDSDSVIYRGFHSYSAEELQNFCTLLKPYFREVLLRGVD